MSTTITRTRTRVTIYSPALDGPGQRLHQPHGWSPSWTGDVPVESLEEVFTYFNRIYDEDASRLRRRGYHLPSLSTGDIIIRQLSVGVTYHVVGYFAFNEITQEQYLAIRHANDPRLAALRYTVSHN